MADKSKESLLAIALQHEAQSTKREHQDLESRIDLALAYANKTITGGQAKHALKSGSYQAILANAIMTGIRHGILKVERVKP